MVEWERLREEIVERLEPLKPEKILLFGSYAEERNGPESDIDLMIVKNLPPEKLRAFRLEARKRLRDLIYRYRIGLDLFAVTEEDFRRRDDYFFRVDLRQKAKILYE
ncbi:nucleotidyltransferase domain-containing protein [Hydrogenimonas sp. SS33]|uniref:nucleotidyltransferase domain-containing protein n=1 Tax=Hydrogenimonas leucolamina TaxID=2954236 RepID=UPI00336BE828